MNGVNTTPSVQWLRPGMVFSLNLKIGLSPSSATVLKFSNHYYLSNMLKQMFDDQVFYILSTVHQPNMDIQYIQILESRSHEKYQVIGAKSLMEKRIKK